MWAAQAGIQSGNGEATRAGRGLLGLGGLGRGGGRFEVALDACTDP